MSFQEEEEEEEVLISQENYDDPTDTTICLPKPVTSFLSKCGGYIKTAFKFACDATFVVFATSFILFGPVIFEMERLRIQQASSSTAANSKKPEEEKEMFPQNSRE
jgi:hypothetical protein